MLARYAVALPPAMVITSHLPVIAKPSSLAAIAVLQQISIRTRPTCVSYSFPFQFVVLSSTVTQTLAYVSQTCKDYFNLYSALLPIGSLAFTLLLVNPHPAQQPIPKGKPKHKKAYLQALDMQAAIQATLALCQADAAAEKDRETRARIGSAMAAMARGWDILEDRKRILRGKPMPGQLRPDQPSKPKRNKAFVLATLDPMQAIPTKDAL